MKNIARGAVLACMVTGMVACAADSRPNETTVKPLDTTASAVQGAETGATVGQSEEARYRDPAPGDFKVTFKVKSEECFGGVGCNVTGVARLAWPPSTFDPDKSYDVTYILTGGSDGPVTETVVVHGDTYDESFMPELWLSTPRRHAKITGKVAEIERAD